jgi:pullulanase/glycogen debranching enzyme
MKSSTQDTYPQDTSVNAGLAQNRRGSWFSTEGSDVPLGAHWIPEECFFNLAIYSKHATSVTSLFFREHKLLIPEVRYELNFRFVKGDK